MECEFCWTSCEQLGETFNWLTIGIYSLNFILMICAIFDYYFNIIWLEINLIETKFCIQMEIFQSNKFQNSTWTWSNNFNYLNQSWLNQIKWKITEIDDKSCKIQSKERNVQVSQKNSQLSLIPPIHTQKIVQFIAAQCNQNANSSSVPFLKVLHHANGALKSFLWLRFHSCRTFLESCWRLMQSVILNFLNSTCIIPPRCDDSTAKASHSDVDSISGKTFHRQQQEEETQILWICSLSSSIRLKFLHVVGCQDEHPERR